MLREKLIEKYFQGTITTRELDELKTVLDDDEVFSREFESEKDVQQAIKHHKREEMGARLSPEMEEFEKELHKRRLSRRKFWSAAASILLLMGLGWHFFTMDTPMGLYKDYYQPYPNMEIMITRDSPDNLQTRAFGAYEMGNYEEASALFIQLKESDMATDVDLYLGISYLELDRTEEAMAYFQDVANKGGKYHSQALWYLSLAQLKSEDEQAAISTLEDLRIRGDYKTAEARELLEKLN